LLKLFTTKIVVTGLFYKLLLIMFKTLSFTLLKKKFNSFLIVFICFLSLTFNEGFAQGSRLTDSLALVDLYNATNGANWTNKWNLSQPITTWYGVTVAPSVNRVWCIRLDGYPGCGYGWGVGNTGNNLVGTLPNLNLPELFSLNLAFNKLSGNIPSLKLPKLQSLVLCNNQLSGCIPQSIKTNCPLITTGYINNNLDLATQIWANYWNNTEGACVTCTSVTASVTGKTTLCGTGTTTLTATTNAVTPTYLWSTGATTASINVSTPNTYSVTVTQGDGCVKTASTIISADNSCRCSDSLQLVSLYNSTAGANWTNKWVLTQPMTTWYGVTLNATGCVSVIDLDGNINGGSVDGNNLVGTIPNINLPNLQKLILVGNKLSGSLPNFSLLNLQELELSYNQLSGNIPNFNLPNLQGLGLGSNQLSGNIPNFNLPNLQGLVLSSNQLSGSIPIFNFLNLRILYLGLNKLSGNIPNFNFPILQTLELSSNVLTGSIPNFSLPNLTRLYLSTNQLSGCIPQGIKTNCPLITATGGDISTNPSLNTQSWGNFWNNAEGACITCAAPATPLVSSITSTDVKVSWVAVTGATSYNVESKIATATTWNVLSNISTPSVTMRNYFLQGTAYNVRVTTNCTSGTSTPSGVVNFTPSGRAFPAGLPTCLEDDFRNLEKLYDATSGNTWIDKTGWFSANLATWKGITLTADGCDVKNIILRYNNLVGTIPNLNFPNLVQLNLGDNKLGGSIPNFNLPSLLQLELGANKLIGNIPNFNLLNLIDLILAENQLTGSIPDFNLPNLVNLNLAGNQLTGAIPNFNLTNLKYLHLVINQLSGSIPNFNLPQLMSLGLSFNNLSGTIPSFNYPKLNALILQNNQLSGCIPQSIRTNCPLITATNGNIANNPSLNTQSWTNYWNNWEGACTPSINTVYRLSPTNLKCSDPIINFAVILGQAVQNINEGYVTKLNYNSNQLELVDVFKGSVVPADASLLKTLVAGNDVFGIALSQNNISGAINDTLLKLQFRLKSVAAVANTAITVSAQIIEAKSGIERFFDANTTFTVTGSSAAKIVVYTSGVLLNSGTTTVQWTGANPTQTATLSGGQTILSNIDNKDLSVNRQVNIPIGAPVIGGQDAFKAWNILSNYALFRPTVDEIIAADVNGDGTITIADLTAILRRGIGLLPTGFPQTSGANKDWRFYPKLLLTTPGFIISSNYPLCDGIGYCKIKVPIIGASYPLQITSTNCDTVTKDWNSVLIGNVTGTTGAFFRNPSVFASLRGARKVKFMFSDTVRTATGLYIPIYVTDSEPTTSLDFTFSSPLVSIKSMTQESMSTSINSGTDVIIISYYSNPDGLGVAVGNRIGYLQVETNRRLNATDLGNVIANVNGDMTNASIEFISSPILAMELTKFEAHPLNKNVELTWSTASEKSNDYFEIQRSRDGKMFSKIANIIGNGTTAAQHNYQLLDESPFSGTNYYRLKQVDTGGQSELSKIVSVDMLNSEKTISVFPNPVKDKVIVETNITGDYTIELLDITGKLLQQHKSNQPSLQLSTSGLPSGIYMISVTSQAINKTFRIVKE
jgi:Secretion system C-terminal sorting domain